MILDPLLARLVVLLYCICIILIVSFASYRVVRFIGQDVITQRPREWLARKLPGRLDYGLTCPWCISFYVVSAFYLVLELFVFSVPFLPLCALASMTIVGFLGNAD